MTAGIGDETGRAGAGDWRAAMTAGIGDETGRAGAGDWRAALARLDAAAVPHVLVTVLETHGSTPREAGAKMVVAEDTQAGSIGGGQLEYAASETARRLLAEGAATPTTEKLMLGADREQCCGGAVTLLYEPMAQAIGTLALFGAGHVGRALVRTLDGSGVRVLWIDERDDALTPPLPGRATPVHTYAPAAYVAELPAGAQSLVMTHSHARDYKVLAALLARPELPAPGLIGSKTKWARFRKQLLADGLPEPRVAAVTCPIGLPGIPGKRPQEIAVAAAADLLRRFHAAGDSAPAEDSVAEDGAARPEAHRTGEAAK
ncbi:xanthine dehydrogenase accessory protein XdhC [Rhodovibrio sodomensis]|uniref:Xanthine dehydrogenase accessory protein XdhC n=1 Tax=Rhodovibrio sodomensis TaxID=1088 RepID=A0ABS1DA29_9PROT|nr:xanthine dehydrogenase accessory protein XdhC [Rhodovibrio sodomensis]MBK1667288.1 xanthine dehydrogenase accessory protein XdhC [Rhodovibrio sodomensis]